MSFRDTPEGMTTLLFAAFALFVIYTRLRNWLDSNVPLMFYVGMIVYANAVDLLLPAWMLYTGLCMAMFLRFEFMNSGFTKFIKFGELCILSSMLFLCLNQV